MPHRKPSMQMRQAVEDVPEDTAGCDWMEPTKVLLLFSCDWLRKSACLYSLTVFGSRQNCVGKGKNGWTSIQTYATSH